MYLFVTNHFFFLKEIMAENVSFVIHVLKSFCFYLFAAYFNRNANGCFAQKTTKPSGKFSSKLALVKLWGKKSLEIARCFKMQQTCF